MKRWAIRIVAFVLIAMGAFGAQVLLERHLLRGQKLEQSLVRMHDAELVSTGTMLADWLATGQRDKAERYIEAQRREGRSVALFDAELRRLAGAPPAETALAEIRAELARDEAGNFPGPPPGPGMAPPPRVRLFTGLDGARYVVRTAHIGPLPMPGPSRGEFLRMLAIALCVAVLFALLVAPTIEWSSQEPRKVLQRLAKGDLGVRMEPQPDRGRAYRTLARDFNATMDILEARQQEQRMMLYGLSHDMRSPLARMALAMDMVLEEDENGSLRLLRRARDEADHLNRLVGCMVHMMRAEDETQSKELVDLHALGAALAEQCAIETASQAKAIRLDCTGTALVRGNRGQLRSMLENVLRNAIRHAPRNTEVILTLADKERNGRPFIQVCIADAGQGVPDSELAAIFRPFHLAADGEPGKGMGLGLAIARHVAHSHSGRIYADNLPRGGFAVSIELPRAEAPEGESAPEPEQEALAYSM